LLGYSLLSKAILGVTNFMTTSTTIQKTLMLLSGATFIVMGASIDSAKALTFGGGKDSGVNGSDARPNSALAASQFDAAAGALGAVNIIDFESFKSGELPNSTTIPGVTISASGSGANSISTDNSNTLGFNTTAGGSNFLQSQTSLTTTFTFATPIQAFGAYITGLGTAPGNALLNFSDGSTQSYDLTALIGDANGGAGFFGFTDAGKSISSIAFAGTTSGQDIYGIDDVRYVAVPTPALLPGLIGIGLGVWRKRKAAMKDQAE
jgi:hypothetical protein